MDEYASESRCRVNVHMISPSGGSCKEYLGVKEIGLEFEWYVPVWTPAADLRFLHEALYALQLTCAKRDTYQSDM